MNYKMNLRFHWNAKAALKITLNVIIKGIKMFYIKNMKHVETTDQLYWSNFENVFVIITSNIMLVIP